MDCHTEYSEAIRVSCRIAPFCLRTFEQRTQLASCSIPYVRTSFQPASSSAGGGGTVTISRGEQVELSDQRLDEDFTRGLVWKVGVG